MVAGKARQREMSVPDLVIAKLTTTALASSPVCGQSASADSSSPPPTQSDQCGGKVSSEGFKEDVTHASHVSQASRPPQRCEKMESFLQAMSHFGIN